MSDYDELVNWLSENHHEVFCQWAQVVCVWDTTKPLYENNVNREEVEKAIKDNKKKINERANAWQEAKDDLRGFKAHDYHDDIFLQNFYPDC